MGQSDADFFTQTVRTRESFVGDGWMIGVKSVWRLRHLLAIFSSSSAISDNFIAKSNWPIEHQLTRTFTFWCRCSCSEMQQQVSDSIKPLNTTGIKSLYVVIDVSVESFNKTIELGMVCR